MSAEVTVFTSTYNRGYIIHNLYESLRRQTNKNFEWIVIDDGSVDNTEILFHQWIFEDNGFEIKYYKVENGGKHRAINKAVNMASAESFFIVDSDDYLVDEAIEKVIEWFGSIREDDSFVGISGLRGFSKNEPVGGWPNYEEEYVDAPNLDKKKYHLLGDKAEVYKTSVLKKFPFPCFENENFITEAVVWSKIGKEGYKIRWFKEVIYICEYREDGLTQAGHMKFVNNPKGYMEYLNLQAEIYGRDYIIPKMLKFYMLLKIHFGEESAAEKMGIDEAEQCEMNKRMSDMLAYINPFFESRNIKDIAIYGLGVVGNEFLDLSVLLNLNIKYAIDQKVKKSERIRVCTLEDKLECVDAVLITLKNYNKEVQKNLDNRFSNVFYWQDIAHDFIN